MTVYAEVQGDKLIQFPYTLGSLQEENPFTDFGVNPDIAKIFPTTAIAIEHGYTLEPVLYLPQPDYDHATEVAIQNSEPSLIDNVWSLGWTVRSMTPEETLAAKNQVKNTASQLLTNTDWTAIPSIADPAQSNPFLANQNAFFEYRNQVRQIAINPPVVVEVWPTEPDEVWETAPTA